MIRISNLSKSFSGQMVLNNLSLEIQKGEVVALIGSSGAGKSTFLRSLNYLEQPDSGTIAIDDFTVDFSKISNEEMLEASVQTFNMNYTLMSSLILKSLSKNEY